jgi:hypothetical protein
MTKQRIMGGELMKPVRFGFVTTRIPATAVAPEIQEVGALLRGPFGSDVPRPRIA